jgi:hypothetical protein
MKPGALGHYVDQLNAARNGIAIFGMVFSARNWPDRQANSS